MSESISKITTQWSDLTTWVLVVFGWAVAIFQQHRIETRKEIHLALEGIYSELLEAHDYAISFHTNKEHDGHLLFKILNIQERAYSKLILLCENLGIPEKDLDAKNTSFRQAVSLNNADSSSFKKQDYSCELLVDISSAHNEYLSFLQTAYFNKFIKKPICSKQ